MVLSHIPLFYISLQVSRTQKQEIAFRVHKTLKVAVLQPAAVSVYEYYDHQHNKREPQRHQDKQAVCV